MGLMQQAYDTYCAMEPQYAGIYGKAKEPLVPVSHQLVNAELELTLDADGHLLDARSVEAEQAATIIPVTESSSGRTGKAPGAHPLCDQIQFLSPLYPAKYESYLTQLHRWEVSPYGHPKLSAIARYVEKGTIVEDLAQRGVISLNEKGLPTKEKQVDRADDPDLAEKMKAEAEGIFLWAFEGLQRLVANNFKFTESDRIRENREAVKRDNNNIFDFMDSEGYIRRKADASISSKDFYAIYRLWCEENSLAPLKSRSFSDAMVANAKKFNLEHCNNITNSAGRRVWGFMGVEAVARPNINGFYDVSPCTYVPEEWQD